MRNRLTEVMRQEDALRTRELEELQGRLEELRASDAAGEQALKRAAEMDHVEQEVELSQCRKQTIDNFFQRLQDEVLGTPRLSKAEAMPTAYRARRVVDDPQA